MKKNKLFILGLITVFACILSLTFVSGTYAKYVTTVTGEATARVAYWGFNGESTDVTFDNLFSTTYTNVQSSNADKVIAPGTNGSATFAFNSVDGAKTPEVAYSFTVSTDGSSCASEIKDNTSIKWKLDDGTTDSWGTWNELLTAIKGLEGEGTYEAGELPTMANKTYTVSWKWEFEGSDTNDTAMGNMTTAPVVTLKITVTATQID